jgi:2-methylcitrate dehydratase
MAETTTVTALADAVAAFDPATLSDDDVEQTKLLTLDTLGCAIAANGVDMVEGVRNLARELGGAPQATLIGGGKGSVLNAILVNGAMVRVLDLNDYKCLTSAPMEQTSGIA